MANKEHKEHALLLYLHPKLQLSLIKYMASSEHGKSFAALIALCTGLRSLGYMDEKTFLELTEKYNVKLVKPEAAPEVSPQAAREIASMTQTFRDVIAQWPYQKDGEWRAKWVKKAREYENRVPNAKYVIALEKGGK